MWYHQQRSTITRTVINNTNMKQIAYFIEFIPHWLPGIQEDALWVSYSSSSSNWREVFIVNISAFDILI